jgi:hypothetical protein
MSGRDITLKIFVEAHDISLDIYKPSKALLAFGLMLFSISNVKLWSCGTCCIVKLWLFLLNLLNRS